MSRGRLDLAGGGSAAVLRASVFGVRPARGFGRGGGGWAEGGSARDDVEEPPRVGHRKLFGVVL